MHSYNVMHCTAMKMNSNSQRNATKSTYLQQDTQEYILYGYICVSVNFKTSQNCTILFRNAQQWYNYKEEQEVV